MPLVTPMSYLNTLTRAEIDGLATHTGGIGGYRCAGDIPSRPGS